MHDLAGKVAVVTGAASGIGRATATAFAAQGMRVVMADIEEKVLDVAARDLAEQGHDVLPVVTDVSSGSSMATLARTTVARFGKVHVVHLNAGVAAGGPIWTLSENDWSWVLGVNLWGVIHGVRTFVPLMLEQGEPAHVVTTASIAGLTSSAFLGPYNVSKHAVVALSETLQRDLALQNAPIGVSVLCPGWVNTGIGDSARNRPDALRDDQNANPADGASMLKSVLESGLDPGEVAAMVVDAVQHDRFYILTHPDWNELIEQRFDDIRGNRTPSPMFLPM